MLKRRNGSAGPGTNGDTEKKTKKRRLVILRWWAAVFGLVVGIALSGATPQLFDDSGALWAVVLLLGTVLMAGVNLHTVGKAHDDAPSWPWPWPRIALSLALAGTVAYSLVLWQFSDDVTTVRNANITRWDRDVPQLTRELADLRKIATRPASTVDSDPQVLGKTATLAEQRKEAATAKENELCEKAGTCGTLVPGEATAYDVRKKRAEETARQVAATEKELVDLRIAVTARVAQENDDRTKAAAEVGEVQAKLDALGAERPEPQSAFSGAWAVGQQKSVPVGGWFVGGFLACLLLDIGAFLFVVWRICRSEVWG